MEEKKVPVVCKCNAETRVKLLYAFWNHIFGYPLDDFKSVDNALIFSSTMNADKESFKHKECKWFYCPAYHFCPFDTTVIPGIAGRKHKRLDAPKSNGGLDSSFGFSDNVEVEVIRNGKVHNEESN